MAGTWKRLAHKKLDSANATIDTGDWTSGGTVTNSDTLKVIIYTLSANNDHYCYIRYNGDSGTEYVYRKNSEGEIPDGNPNTNMIYNDIYVYTRNSFCTMHIKNKSDKEKIAIMQNTGGASGNSNYPARREYVSKWVDKTQQIKRITVHQGNGSNTFDANSYITVWGSVDDGTEDEKDALTNVEAGTQYRETDTRKIYRLDESSLSPSFHYKFSEASGDVVNHGSVASADLSVTSLTRDVATPSGLGNGMSTSNTNTGYAQNTSRVNDYKFMHDGTAKWSVTFWFYATDLPDGSNTENMIMGNIWTDDNGIGWAIRFAYDVSPNSSTTARIQTLIADGNSGMPLNDQSSNGMCPDLNAWHFYCITYDPTLSSNNLTVSRDAETSGDGFHQGDEDNDTYSSSNPTRKTTYMSRPTGSYDLGAMGRLAQVMIFKDVILTQANKVSLYASGNGTTSIPTATSWKERGSA